jgi:uncharacterized protein DUF29
MKETGSNARRKGEESAFVAQEAPAVRIENDYYGWLLDQASVLRRQRYSSLDWSNLAEELEAMAAAERRELLRRLTTLLAHLLKFQYQPEVRRERSRKLTIVRSRTEIKRLLDYSPGLKGQLTEYVAAAYDDAKNDAGVDIRLERHHWEELFPVTCPWTLEQIQSPDYFPPMDSSEKS